MSICVDISGHGFDVTTDATPKNITLFAGNPSSSINGKLTVTARRADGVTKCWATDVALRVDDTGNMTILGLLVALANAVFGSSSDLTAMSAVTFSAFQNGSDLGIAVTGQAGQTITWCADFKGHQIIPG